MSSLGVSLSGSGPLDYETVRFSSVQNKFLFFFQKMYKIKSAFRGQMSKVPRILNCLNRTRSATYLALCTHSKTKNLRNSHNARLNTCCFRECAKYTYMGLRGLDEEIVTGKQREENGILLVELRNGKFSSDKVSKN